MVWNKIENPETDLYICGQRTEYKSNSMKASFLNKWCFVTINYTSKYKKKNELLPKPHILYKNKLKMDHTAKQNPK